MNLNFVVVGNPITKKNSQRIITNPKTLRPMIMPSSQYKQYEKDAMAQIVYGGEPIDVPVTVTCRYYMQTKRACDLTNLLEATDDILVKRRVLADDNYRIIASHDGSRVYTDRQNPRVEISISEYREV